MVQSARAAAEAYFEKVRPNDASGSRTGAARERRLTNSRERRDAQLPKHVRVLVMYVTFRFIGSVIRSMLGYGDARGGPVEKKRVVECETAEAFAEALAEAKAAKRAVVVDFTATWCGPCRRIAPVFADMSEEYDAMFIKVDVDKNGAVSGAHNVTAMPTFAFYTSEGEPHGEQIRGANVAKIVETLEKLGCTKAVKETKKDA